MCGENAGRGEGARSLGARTAAPAKQDRFAGAAGIFAAESQPRPVSVRGGTEDVVRVRRQGVEPVAGVVAHEREGAGHDVVPDVGHAARREQR